MKKIIYTCIAGDIDNLEDPVNISTEFEYICFTNQNFVSKVWNIIPLMKEFDNPRLTARFHKTIGCNCFQSDVVIWQDGKITFKNHIYLNEFYDIGLFKHPARSCIYEEGRAVIHLGKDNANVIKKQLNEYEKNNYPKNNGLYETCVIVRRMNDKINKLNEMWWNEIFHKSIRDQISLPYIIRNLDLKIKLFNMNVYNNDFFSIKHHLFKDYSKEIPLI